MLTTRGTTIIGRLAKACGTRKGHEMAKERQAQVRQRLASGMSEMVCRGDTRGVKIPSHLVEHTAQWDRGYRKTLCGRVDVDDRWEPPTDERVLCQWCEKEFDRIANAQWRGRRTWSVTHAVRFVKATYRRITQPKQAQA